MNNWVFGKYFHQRLSAGSLRMPRRMDTASRSISCESEEVPGRELTYNRASGEGGLTDQESNFLKWKPKKTGK